MYAADPRLSADHKMEMMRKAAMIAMMQQQGGTPPAANMVAAETQIAPQPAPPLQEVPYVPPAMAPGVDLTRPGPMVPNPGLIVDQPGTGAAPAVYDANAVAAGQPINAAPVPIQGQKEFLRLPGHNASDMMGQPPGMPNFEAAPPKTPEEVAARKAGWENLFTQVQQNPAMLMALMRVGADLLQPMPMWQSEGGHFGRAVAGGLDYLQNYEGQKLQREHLKAQTGQVQAQTGQTQALTKTEQQRPDLIQAQTTQVYQNMENDLRQLGFKEEELGLMKGKMKLEGEVSAAQIAKALQDVKESQTLTEAKRFQLEAYGRWLQRRQNSPGSSGGGSAVVQKMQEMKDWYLELGMSEEEATRRALAYAGEGAAGGKAYTNEEQAKVRLESLYGEYKAATPQELKELDNPKSFKEYVKKRNADFEDEEDKAVKSRAYYYADKFEQAQKKAGGKAGAATTPDAAPAAAEGGQPLPMTDGKPDMTKWQKGTRYKFMDGKRSGVWTGNGWEDVK